MLVKAKVDCFIGGSRRKVGDAFEFAGKNLGRCLVAAESDERPAPVAEKPEITTADLRVKLAEMGVKVPPAMGRDKMLALLAEAEGK